MENTQLIIGIRLVIETLEPLSADRKCFRLVNGVLVERTVGDVVPSLKTNADGLKQVLDEMVKQYKAKQTEMDNWKVCLSCLLLDEISWSLVEEWLLTLRTEKE